MKLRNRRPFAVEICPPDHPTIDVEAGAVFEVPDVLGTRLLEQEDNYELADSPPAAAAKKEK